MAPEDSLQSSTTPPPWEPKEGDLTWTRCDRSMARALGIVLRLPPDPVKEAPPSNLNTNVFCDVDFPDRYAIAILDSGESHCYAPRHYLKPFDLQAAQALKCVKLKSARDLSPWEREKRRSILAAAKWLKDHESLSSAHDFAACPECCDEASPAFWEKVEVTPGTAHVDNATSLESRRLEAKKEYEEREQLLKERAELKGSKQSPSKTSAGKSSSANKTSPSSSPNKSGSSREKSTKLVSSRKGSSSSSGESSEATTKHDDSESSSEEESDNGPSSSGDELSEPSDDSSDETLSCAEEDEVHERKKTTPKSKAARRVRQKARPLLASSSGDDTESEEEAANPPKRIKTS